MMDLEGHFLIAAQELEEDNFRHTVVLIIRHNDEGAMGLIINRPTELSVADAWAQVSEEPCRTGGLMHFGGPCESLLSILHEDEARADTIVQPGLYMTMSMENAERLMSDPAARMKCFFGYAGWAAGQLEDEVRAGGWLLLEAAPEDVFREDEVQWEHMTQRVACLEAFPTLDPKIVPDDPSLN